MFKLHLESQSQFSSKGVSAGLTKLVIKYSK